MNKCIVYIAIITISYYAHYTNTTYKQNANVVIYVHINKY